MHILRAKYSCIIDTPYALFLYLLMCNDGDWDRTVFFVGSGIDETCLKHVKKVVHFSSNYDDYATHTQLLKAKLRALFYRLKYISHTKLYAQDHLVFSSQLIGRNKYVHIEDAPGFYSFKHAEVSPIPTRLRPMLRRLLYWGPVVGQSFGRNKYCIDRWVTELEDLNSPILREVHCTLLNLKQLWNSASEVKKQYINEVFGLNDAIIQSLRRYQTIIFTQPFAEDGLALEDIAPILKPYIERYQSEGVVIKPHPRDHMDWNKAFPDMPLLTLRTPMQILNVLGVEYKRAITFYSTAISSLNPETEIIWLGTEVVPKLYVQMGDVQCPYEGKFKNIRYA